MPVVTMFVRHPQHDIPLFIGREKGGLQARRYQALAWLSGSCRGRFAVTNALPILIVVLSRQAEVNCASSWYRQYRRSTHSGGGQCVFNRKGRICPVRPFIAVIAYSIGYLMLANSQIV